MRDNAGGTGQPDHKLDDESLLAQIVTRDPAAFTELYDRYADVIFGVAVRFVRDRSIAAEISQDTFMAVWQRGTQFNADSGSVIGWMLGIVRNRAIDRLRQEARRPRLASAWSDRSNAGDDGLDGWASREGEPAANGPPAEIERRWLQAVIRTTLAELRVDEREVLVLAYDHALSQSEIAKRLGVPIGTVKSRTRRALARLRIRLDHVPDLRARDPSPTRSGSAGDR